MAQDGLYHWETTQMSVSEFPFRHLLPSHYIRNIQKVNDRTIFLLSSYKSAPINEGFSLLFESPDSGQTLIPYNNLEFVSKNGLSSAFLKEDGVGRIISRDRWYTTNDIGGSWQEIKDSILEFPFLSDVNGNTIVTNTYYTSVTVSSDFGLSWQRKALPDSMVKLNVLLNRAVLMDTSTLFMYRQDGNMLSGSFQLRLYRSTDLGSSWQNLRCPIEGYENDTAGNCLIRILKFIDAGRICLGNIAYLDSTKTLTQAIIRSTDKGMHWSIVQSEAVSQYHSYIGYVYHVDGDTVIMAYMSGRMLISSDAGVSWKLYVDEVPNYIGEEGRPNFVTTLGSMLFYDSHTAVATYDGGRQDGIFNVMYLKPGKTATPVKSDEDARKQLESSMVWLESCYPMPVGDKAQIVANFTYGVEMDRVTAEVYDLLGSSVAKFKSSDLVMTPHTWGSGWYTVNVSMQNLESGTYIINICDGKGDCKSKSVCHVRP